jgi:eukaryotic-like serine/threonine-protein kinase
MTTPNDATESFTNLDQVIAEYLQAIEAGQIPNRRELLDRHPDLAELLGAFFADFDRVDLHAAPLRLAGDAGRLTSSSAANASGPNGLATIRYFGDYELLEEIARGGMGVVYKARQASLNRIVALKMILKGLLATTIDVARFHAEAESAAGLDHPHIVPIYEVGSHEGHQYFAMRFVEGTTLARAPRQSARTEVNRLIDIARAVHFAHQRGILHRDLKPSNVLIDPAGTAFVTDFGLAKRTGADSSLTETGQPLGTPRYMAPEQAAGRKDLTVGVDVYSLGVILYERLTGRPPFLGDNVLEVLQQVRGTDPPRPSAIQPALSRDLETISLKCLEKDTGRRYASAEALAEDLDHWLKGEPITARRVSSAERAWLWARRNPALAGSLFALVCTLIIMVVASTLFASLQLKLAQQLTAANRTAEAQRVEAQTYATKLALDQGLTLGRSGISDALEGGLRLGNSLGATNGFLKLAQALEFVPTGDGALEQTVRRMLAASSINFPETAIRLEPTPPINCAAFSRDGRRLFIGSADGVVRIIDPATGRLRMEIPILAKETAKSIFKLAIESKGSAFAAWNGKQARTWSLDTGKPLGPAIPLVAPPEGQGGDQSPAKQDGLGLTEDHSISTKDFVTVEFSSDGAYILTTYNRDQKVSEACCWDVETGRRAGPPIQYEGVQGSITAAFRHDGKVVAVRGKDQAVRLFDTRTGNALSESIHPEGGIWSVAFSPDGQWLLTGEDKGIFQIRNAVTGLPIGLPRQNPVKMRCCFAAFSRDGCTIVALESEFGWLWDTANNLVRATVEWDGVATNQLEPFDTGGFCLYKGVNHPVLVDVSTGRSVIGWRYSRLGSFSSRINTPGFLAVLGDQYIAAFDPTYSTLLLDAHSTLLLDGQTIRDERCIGLFQLQPVRGSKRVVRLWAELVARASIGPGDQLRPFDETSWQEQRQQLLELIGSESVSDNVRLLANDSGYWLRCGSSPPKQQPN